MVVVSLLGCESGLPCVGETPAVCQSERFECSYAKVAANEHPHTLRFARRDPSLSATQGRRRLSNKLVSRQARTM